MKNNQLEQQFTNLAPLVEEISDDKSASIIGGASFGFSAIVPSIGPTGPRRLTTSNDISIQMFQNPYDLKLKVAQFGKRDVNIHIPANSRKVYTIAADVDTTGFNLSFDAPTTDLSFGIAGQITS